MTCKLWDLRRENAPIATFPVHEHLRSRVSGLLRAAQGLLNSFVWCNEHLGKRVACCSKVRDWKHFFCVL
jgi:serine/threonine-protein phosphatase 2A regulatory subunit B